MSDNEVWGVRGHLAAALQLHSCLYDTGSMVVLECQGPGVYTCACSLYVTINVLLTGVVGWGHCEDKAYG